jgi:spore maturation protein CgeB
MKVLCIGPLWRGSNAGGLFSALSRNGCYIDIVDEYYYISFHSGKLTTKVLQKLIRPLQIEEFNKAITSSVDLFKPDVVLVYKGAFVTPQTLNYAKGKGCKLVLFYPDVSMTAHGNYLSQDIPLYDLVFTTKTFGIKDLEQTFEVKNAVFIPHGFDRDIHRKLQVEPPNKSEFKCDVSFIGTYSPKKENYLAALKKSMPDIDLKIWGAQWNRSKNKEIQSSIQNTVVSGDLYALAIQSSSINLGILSEKVEGSTSGDKITSRTFHIPASYGFMLHERNEESITYFKEDEEVVFFDSEEEMQTQVEKYLKNEPARETIREAGYNRAVKDHSLDSRALNVIQHLSSLL